jgi:hypothetical protein
MDPPGSPPINDSHNTAHHLTAFDFTEAAYIVAVTAVTASRSQSVR